MMQRRAKHVVGPHGTTASNNDDDGGSAKHKTHPLLVPFAPRLPASIPPRSAAVSECSSRYCLPGVPAPLKFILLSFLGFAALMVMTAKDRHVHHHYKNHKEDSGIRGGMQKEMLHGVPHAPESLHKKIVREKYSQPQKSEGTDTINKAAERSASVEASERMLNQPSRFVDSEKKLKQQLLLLMEKQKAEKKSSASNPNDSVLGIKISNRYLGEDLLPYPESKGGEKEWEKLMQDRKKELSKVDAQEWKELMQQYSDMMEDIVQDTGVEDHSDESIHNSEEHMENNHVEDTTKEELSPPALAIPKHGTAKSKLWPTPAEKEGEDNTILLKPAFGTHRPASNAIFVFAEGYDLSIYLAFVESLVNTGYTGDVVLSISSEDKLKPDVKEYLLSKNARAGLNIVAYEVEWSCFKRSGQAASGSGEGMHHCQMNHAFGNASGEAIPDPREPRPVATARYELYWMWSLQYNSDSWLMLIDARDAWFQLDPFKGLATSVSPGDDVLVAGELHLFGENADVVRIGTSNYNRNWLVTAYGKNVVEPYFEKPVICSGSTMGQQVAIETYLRAMVAEFDATNCKSKGCDQGFHNYLYYSGKLGHENDDVIVEGIAKVIVHDQGKGIINNLGALRDKPLSEWGLYDAKKEVVLQWDGSVSAVAHQYDRDKEVNAMVRGKKRLFEKQWKDFVAQS